MAGGEEKGTFRMYIEATKEGEEGNIDREKGGGANSKMEREENGEETKK
jgi:hypothetical protein